MILVTYEQKVGNKHDGTSNVTNILQNMSRPRSVFYISCLCTVHKGSGPKHIWHDKSFCLSMFIANHIPLVNAAIQYSKHSMKWIVTILTNCFKTLTTDSIFSRRWNNISWDSYLIFFSSKSIIFHVPKKSMINEVSEISEATIVHWHKSLGLNFKSPPRDYYRFYSL